MCHCVGASRPRGRLWMPPLWDEGRYVYAENKRTRCCDHTGDKRDVRCKCSLTHSFSLRDTLPHPCLFPPSLVTLQGPEHKEKHLNDGRAVWCVDEQTNERDREREREKKKEEKPNKKSLFRCCSQTDSAVAKIAVRWPLPSLRRPSIVCLLDEACTHVFSRFLARSDNWMNRQCADRHKRNKKEEGEFFSITCCTQKGFHFIHERTQWIEGR